MRKINSNLESYFNKIIPRTNTNYLCTLIKDSKKGINNELYKSKLTKSSLNQSRPFFLIKTEERFSCIFNNHLKDISHYNISKSNMLINTASKSFVSKNSNNKTLEKKEKLSNKNATTDFNNFNTEKNIKNQNTNKDPSSKKIIETSEKNIEFNSETKNYNPELIDKQSNLFNLTDKLPEKIQYYIKLGRYDRPIGYLLLFYPCTWGLTLATPFLDLNFLYQIFLFLSGSVLMRSAGCIINDMWDRNIDKMVERSKNRPLAAGFLSMKEASGFLGIHLALSLAILLQLPVNSIIAGLGIMPIVVIYPFMKRVTNVPQVVLGTAFNSGVLVGYAAFETIIYPEIIIPIYLGGIFWTVIYDTIYAHMDKLDDAKINVKSTALYFGQRTKFFLHLINFIMFLCFLFGFIYYEKQYISDKNKYKEKPVDEKKNDSIVKIKHNVINNSKTKSEFDIKEFSFKKVDLSIILLCLGHFYQARLIKNVNLNDPLSCLKTFKKSSLFGVVIFACCFLKVLKREKITSKELNEKSAE